MYDVSVEQPLLKEHQCPASTGLMIPSTSNGLRLRLSAETHDNYTLQVPHMFKLQTMCRPIGVDWTCGCSWRGWDPCSTYLSHNNQDDSGCLARTELFPHTETFEEYADTRQELHLKLQWCCSEECCRQDANERHQAAFKAWEQSVNPHQETLDLRNAYVRAVERHTSMCVPRCHQGLGASNAMKTQFGQNINPKSAWKIDRIMFVELRSEAELTRLQAMLNIRSAPVSPGLSEGELSETHVHWRLLRDCAKVDPVTANRRCWRAVESDFERSMRESVTLQRPEITSLQFRPCSLDRHFRFDEYKLEMVFTKARDDLLDLFEDALKSLEISTQTTAEISAQLFRDSPRSDPISVAYRLFGHKRRKAGELRADVDAVVRRIKSNRPTSWNYKVVDAMIFVIRAEIADRCMDLERWQRNMHKLYLSLRNPSRPPVMLEPLVTFRW